MRVKTNCSVLAVAAFVSALLCRECQADEAFHPHRVVGNVYYVGSRDISSFLITTPKGHFIINSGFEETVPLIRASVEQLGFRMKDIKVLLASHAHSDHVAGHARLQRLTGAKVHVMKGDDGVIRSGGEGQYLYTDSRWPKCPVDRVLKDGDKVELDDTSLVARRTAGHTRGCTTWTLQITEGDRKLNAVIVGSPNVNPGYELVGNRTYKEIATDYAKGFAILKKLKCDVFLGAHGKYYGMLEKFPNLKEGKPNPFIDSDGYQDYITEREENFRRILAEQQKQAAAERTKIPEKAVANLESHEDLTYAKYGGRELQLDLYRPKKRAGRLPGVVCIHGGGWANGNRKGHGTLAKAIAARGYVAVTISYRLSGEAPFPAAIHDCKAAVRWLRANADNFGIDADHIAATGLSAGGHLVALLATSGDVEELEGTGGNSKFSSTIQAAAPMGAQTDFESERTREISKTERGKIWRAFLGGPQEEQLATYRLASPLTHLDAKDPPFVFITGEKDDPSTRASKFRDTAKKLGVETGITVISGAPHPFLGKQVWFDAAVNSAVELFDSQLK
jgi:acetyl esterase/lipase/glyoxylase-like metal-dependent hydrolase (beta-lactamase superfamily II)